MIDFSVLSAVGGKNSFFFAVFVPIETQHEKIDGNPLSTLLRLETRNRLNSKWYNIRLQIDLINSGFIIFTVSEIM